MSVCVCVLKCVRVVSVCVLCLCVCVLKTPGGRHGIPYLTPLSWHPPRDDRRLKEMASRAVVRGRRALDTVGLLPPDDSPIPVAME